jgi:hypothetical protein
VKHFKFPRYRLSAPETTTNLWLGNRRHKKTPFLVVICQLWAGTGQANGFFDQLKDPDDGWFDGGDWLLNNAAGFLPVPIIVTEPATGPGLGVAGVFLSVVTGPAVLM